jgi:hypothetical protein
MLFFLQQLVVEPRLPEIPELTSEMGTDPIYEFDCRIIGQNEADSRLIFRHEGGRAYYAKLTDGTLEKSARKTRPTYTIVEDKSGRFSSMKFERFGSYFQNGSIFRDDEGDVAVFRADRDPESNLGTMSVYLYNEGSREPTLLAGPCMVTRIEQRPLDHDPEA